MRRVVAMVMLAVGVAVSASCQTEGVARWFGCDSSASAGGQWGTDGRYVLQCREVESLPGWNAWFPVMTVDEFVAILQGADVEVAPVPTRPRNGFCLAGGGVIPCIG